MYNVDFSTLQQRQRSWIWSGDGGNENQHNKITHIICTQKPKKKAKKKIIAQELKLSHYKCFQA